jgi:hypothetical protein
MDALRGLFTGISHFALTTDVLVLFVFTIGTLAAATFLFTKIEA